MPESLLAAGPSRRARARSSGASFGACAVAACLSVVGCGIDGPVAETPSIDSVTDPSGKADGVVPNTGISWRRAPTRALVAASRPAAGRYRIHLIDVGTGLSLLFQGADFTMLYDGGSGDDRAGITTVGGTTHNGNRLLAYLAAAIGPSGPKSCTPDGDGWPQMDRPRVRIDHVFLSHPHEDHDSLLDEVLTCYDVRNVWDSGDNNGRLGYRNFMSAMAAIPGVVYHNAAGLKAGQMLSIFGRTIQLPPSTVPMAENDSVALGAGARLQLLHVDGRVTQDENLNSTVVRLQLGGVSMLIAGDEESGPRQPLEANPGQMEADLLDRQSAQLKADIYQVAHHGSSTSNRNAFLAKVQPRLALLSVGPLPYSGVMLPDQTVLDGLHRLASNPTLLRTDLTDGTLDKGCLVNKVAVNRIGNDDTRPGGCDNYVIDIAR